MTEKCTLAAEQPFDLQYTSGNKVVIIVKHHRLKTRVRILNHVFAKKRMMSKELFCVRSRATLCQS